MNKWARGLAWIRRRPPEPEIRGSIGLTTNWVRNRSPRAHPQKQKVGVKDFKIFKDEGGGKEERFKSPFPALYHTFLSDSSALVASAE